MSVQCVFSVFSICTAQQYMVVCAVTPYAISWESTFQLMDDVVCKYVTKVLPNIDDFKELNTISINCYREL